MENCVEERKNKEPGDMCHPATLHKPILKLNLGG